MPKRFKIALIATQSPDAAGAIQRALSSTHAEAEISAIGSTASFWNVAAETSPDIVLVDLDADKSALELPAQLRTEGLDIPVIFISDEQTAEAAIRSMRAGAHDYLIKSKLFRLPSAIERALSIVHAAREARKAELRHRKAEERYKIISELMSDAIWDYDPVARRFEWNDGFYRVFGFDRSRDVGSMQWYVSRIHAEDAGRIASSFQIARESRAQHWNAEYRFLNAGSRYVHVHNEARMLYDHGGTLQHVVGAMKNITHQKEIEEHLLQAKNHAEQMNALKSSFLANMSHEIRTPMTAILGFTSLLLDTVKEPEVRHHLSVIESAGKRLLQTINGILDIARIESNKLEYRAERIDVWKMIEEVIQTLQPLAATKNLHLELIGSPSDLRTGYLDPQFLHRVLMNVVGNALKFTEHGSVVVRAERIALGEAPGVSLEISDTGVGIGAENFESIFSEFRQESQGLGRRYEGSGLGLTITRHLVNVMGGAIHVRSVKGKGSTFVIELPYEEPLGSYSVLDDPMANEQKTT
jgi:PAS domain S-box-containing protein